MWRTTMVSAVMIAAVAGLWVGFHAGRSSRADMSESIPRASETSSNETDDAPRVTIQTTTADLGEVSVGKAASFDFAVTNSGKGILELKAKPRCGCTVVDYDQKLAAGQQGHIKVELRTSRLHGKFEKWVDVQTNDPDQPRIRLAIAGSAIEAVVVTPSRNPSATLNWEGPTALEFGLKTIDEVQVTKASCHVPYAEVQLIPDGDRGYRLKLNCQPNAPLGRSSFVVMLSTTADSQREIPITIHCEKGIIVTPSEIRLGTRQVSSTASASATVMIRQPKGSLEIRGAKCSDPRIDVQVIPIKAGSLYRLKIIGHGELDALDASAVVSVETDDPHQPLLEIPLRKPVRDAEMKRKPSSDSP